MRNLIKALLAGTAIIFSVCMVHGQSSTQSIYESGVNVSLIQPSPTAASFEKFGLTPVALQNGTPNVSIPIYDMKCGDLSMPISLSYNNNGFKTQEEAGWVGLGWNLNVGGVITRILKGSVDGSRADGKNFGQFNAVDSATTGGYALTRPFLFSVYHLQDYDTEPDIFVYNFAGHSGKFMVVNNTVYMLDYERLKIVPLSDDSGFQIVTDDGTSYLFSTIEESRSIKTSDLTMGQGYVSAWHLTSIHSADGKDWLNFFYTPYLYVQGDYVTGQTYTMSLGEFYNPQDCAEPGGPGLASQSLTNTQSYSNQVDGKSLGAITSSDGQTISFIQNSASRMDIGSSENALQQIVVSGQAGSADTVIKRVSLATGYFTNQTPQSNAVYNRLKLSGVYMQDGAGDTLNKYTFSYYHENDVFPTKNTFAEDAWGYFNNSKNGEPETEGTIIPKMTFISWMFGAQQTDNIPFADRTPNADAASYGVLKQINYPTGGYSTFSYQQNTYNNGLLTPLYSPPGTGFTNFPFQQTYYGSFTINQEQYVHIAINRDLPAGDSLVKNDTSICTIFKCTNCVGDDDTPGFKPVYQVYYQSPPLYSTNSRADSLDLLPGSYSYSVFCPANFVDAGAYFSYFNNVPNYDGSPAPGLRVSTISDYDGSSPNPVLQRNYVYRDSLGYTSGYLYENTLNTAYSWENTLPTSEGLCDGTGMFYYAFPSDNNGLCNGSLNFKQYYTAVREYVSSPQDSTKNYYTEHYYAPVLLASPPMRMNVFNMPLDLMACIFEDLILTDPEEVETIKWKQRADGYSKIEQSSTSYNYIQDAQIVGIKPTTLTPQIDNLNGDPMESRWMYDQYTIYCLWKYPLSKQDIVYDDFGGTLVKNTTYTFDSTKRELRETDEDAGNGKTIITKYKYADDYEVNPMDEMYEYNILSPVVETQIWEEVSGVKTLLKGVITNYDSALFKPSQKFFLYNSSPLAGPNNEQIDNPPLYMNLIDDSHYHEKARFLYSTKGRVIEEVQDSGQNVPTAYVWGYGDVYPVAKIVGAHFSQVLGVIDTGAIQSVRTDAALRSALAPLRNIPGAQVTIYTYRPYVGISSVTDMNNRTTYYDYDKFYRLADIKDFNGNILKTYQYNYKK